MSEVHSDLEHCTQVFLDLCTRDFHSALKFFGEWYKDCNLETAYVLEDCGKYLNLV